MSPETLVTFIALKLLTSRRQKRSCSTLGQLSTSFSCLGDHRRFPDKLQNTNINLNQHIASLTAKIQANYFVEDFFPFGSYPFKGLDTRNKSSIKQQYTDNPFSRTNLHDEVQN